MFEHITRGIHRFIPLVAIILALAISTPALSQIIVEPDKNVEETVAEGVKQVVKHFNTILSEELKVSVTQKVTIYVCANQESFQKALSYRLNLNHFVAQEYAKIYSGFSSGTAMAIALRGDSNALRNPSKRTAITAHELFHQVQSQIVGGPLSSRYGGYKWFVEGTADLLGAKIMERLGLGTLAKWQLDQMNTLRNSPNHASPEEILRADWISFDEMVARKKSPYQVADMMILYLLERTGSMGFRYIPTYFHQLRKGFSGDRAFEQAFGITHETFSAEAQGWFKQVMAREGGVEIVAGGVPADLKVEIERLVGQTSQLFREKLGGGLTSQVRIVLAVDKAAYVENMMKEFGIKKEEAEKRAGNTTWWSYGSTTILNTGASAPADQRAFSIASCLALRHVDQLGGESTAKLNWFRYGFRDVLAAQSVEISGFSTFDRYRKVWLDVLKKANSRPSLNELASTEEWSSASSKYGNAVASRTADLAVLHLIEQKGQNGAKTWLESVKQGTDIMMAFERVFGISLDQFQDDFETSLKSALR
jgi:hypothetical protein